MMKRSQESDPRLGIALAKKLQIAIGVVQLKYNAFGHGEDLCQPPAV